MGSQPAESGAWVTRARGKPDSLNVRQVNIEIVLGPSAGEVHAFEQQRIRIGAAKACDLVVRDPRISGMHAEISLDERGFRIRDLESTNGTYVKGVRVQDGYIPLGARVALGSSEFQIVPTGSSKELELAERDELHGLVGSSVPMRQVYRQIQKLAQTDISVLITGETGVGKELVAEAIHLESDRRDAPLVVVDCGSIPENLFESELFGYVRGAFTGAEQDTKGAFERAQGGTVFLDEIGELPMSLQPKLLRAVQEKTVTRLGDQAQIECDVRLLAATNRDLAVEVNRGRFRADLYYRIAVAPLRVPTLRERMEDIPLLVKHLAARATPEGDQTLGDDVIARFVDHSWPGNVRELRNAVERSLLAPAPLPSTELPIGGSLDIRVPYKTARKHLVDAFDRRFLNELLTAHDWNISGAARATGLDRMTVYKMLRRLKLERPH